MEDEISFTSCLLPLAVDADNVFVIPALMSCRIGMELLLFIVN